MFRSPDRFLLVMLMFATLAGNQPIACAAADLRYFDAESGARSQPLLKSQFDAYLSTQGPSVFRPFSTRKDFEQTSPATVGDLVMISSWHFRRLRSDRSLEAVFVG